MDKLTPITYAFGNLNQIKQAALLNDCVFPFPFEVFSKKSDFCLSEQVVEHINEFIPYKVYKELMFPLSYIVGYANKTVKDYGNWVLHCRNLVLLQLFTLGSFSADLASGKFIETIPIEQKYEYRIVDDAEAEKIEIKSEADEFRSFGFEPNYVLPSSKLASSQAVFDDISVILSGINLIDTSSATWDQIIEFRKNDEAKKKLRNLRLFLQTNYSGKTRSFIEDDFGKRIDDYNSVVKEYGFNTKVSVISFITNSKNLQTFGTASIAAVILGHPFVATTSLLTGVSLEVIKATIEFTNKRHAFNKLKKEHELSYIMDFYEFIK
jgi:hypothetical protein